MSSRPRVSAIMIILVAARPSDRVRYWRGASKNRRWQARVAKIGRRAGQDVADD